MSIKCCYVSQNTLLTQCVFKVSAFGFNAVTVYLWYYKQSSIYDLYDHYLPTVILLLLVFHHPLTLSL